MLFNKDWDRPHTNPLSEMMLKAADLLEKHGYAKHQLIQRDGSMCIMGAMNMANHGCVYYRNNYLNIKRAAEIIKKMYDLPRDSHAAVIHEYQTIIDVVDWNNSEERTAQEVIDALRLAARVAIKENA